MVMPVPSESLTWAIPDTKHYWKLTKHIFRYNHSSGRKSKGKGQVFGGAHTVNESKCVRIDDGFEVTDKVL